MTHREFSISDLHLGHGNMLKFVRADGKTPVRDFTSVDEMDLHIINCWNKEVRPNDKVYVHGDVVINRKALHLLGALNGRKCLIKGNHDIFKLSDYTPYFYDICAVKVKPKYGFVMTHVPIHPESFNRRSWRINIHGHTHTNNVKTVLDDFDLRYYNVCVEQIDYTPKDLEWIYEFTKNINREVDNCDKLI